ncbi:hypothetical protein MYP_174 [Sporocytophaga myxococcoides]|uniref:DUF4241 domain-containing protein n=1 Tax=Sporocytophaga myxococcoides TaxID=153721 RepID=A0A098L9U9_9BACT|nr:DUF4241 domain-containing protein [Sporocytophaga myxococcoides]GAL82948.1 hypothetical protein MYP_174 [Sporocytophaga myxococcoides]
MIKYPSFLEDSFSKGYSIIEEGITYTFQCQDMGNINIHSGKVLTCDPLNTEEVDAFVNLFPIGSFPVELAIADIETDERIAFARIKFSEEKPVRWEFALLEGQRMEDLQDGEIFGYAVDSGLGCFMDLSALDAYEFYAQKNKEYHEEIFDQMDEVYKDTRTWYMWKSKEDTIAIFTTGYGDDVYQSYVGFDNDGRICRLVTDFNLLEWNK